MEDNAGDAEGNNADVVVDVVVDGFVDVGVAAGEGEPPPWAVQARAEPTAGPSAEPRAVVEAAWGTRAPGSWALPPLAGPSSVAEAAAGAQTLAMAAPRSTAL